jgi:hypothetical protein
MSGEVIYELFRETPPWSRALVPTCAVVVALLALWIFISIAFGNHVSAPHHHARDAQTLAPHSKAATATNDVRVIGVYSARPTDSFEPLGWVVEESSHDTDRGAVPWRATRTSLQTPAFDVDTVAIPHPPLPRRRPHVGAIIPLPHPRPALESDAHAVVPDYIPDRFAGIN